MAMLIAPEKSHHPHSHEADEANPRQLWHQGKQYKFTSRATADKKGQARDATPPAFSSAWPNPSLLECAKLTGSMPSSNLLSGNTKKRA